METPSSMRRTQTSAIAQKSKQEGSLSRSRTKGKPDRSVLLDITNDSPIVGLASGCSLTPASTAAKSQEQATRTPGSGEALLRGQVKNLLQKVEAAEIRGRVSTGGGRPPFRAALGLLKSPSQLLAPTPANTPQIPNLCGIKEEDVLPMAVIMDSVAQEREPKIPTQVVGAAMRQDESLDCQINRALFFDSPSKSDVSDASTVSSSLTYQSSHIEKSTEDDNSSVWSIQVNASTQEDDDDEGEELDSNNQEEGEQVEEQDEAESFDDLCKELMKMTMELDKKGLPEFAGKHTRFIYNSDDEMEGEEEAGMNAGISPGVLVLKGLPVPEGKHLRFQDDEEED